MANKEISRRSFLQIFSTSLVAVPALFSVSNLFAEKVIAPPPGPKPVEETNPMATAMGYKKDASTVDTKKYRNYSPEKKCSNCSRYTKLNEGWGKCSIIMAGPVAAGGWCNSYAKK